MVKNRINDHNEYQGVLVALDFVTILGRCSPASFADLHRLEKNLKKHLEWSEGFLGVFWSSLIHKVGVEETILVNQRLKKPVAMIP